MNSFLNERESIQSRKGTLKEDKSSLKSMKPCADEAIKDVSPQGEGPMPKVEVISVEGKVTRILVNCTCGKCIELHCDY